MGLPILNFQVRYSEEVILKQYGDKVSVLETALPLIKFGKNYEIVSGVTETIWNTGGDEVYATTNIIDTVSSSNATDAQTISVTGHTIDANGDFTRVVQEITLDGQNKVLLPTPVARVERMFNTDNTDFLGVVYVYEDDTIIAGVPQTAVNIHLTVNPEDNQSLKAAFTADKDEYIVITALTVSVNKTVSSAIVDFALEIREKGKVFRTKYTSVVSSQNGSRQLFFEQPFIIPPSADVRFIATSNANNTGVEAIAHCYYAKKTYRNV